MVNKTCSPESGWKIGICSGPGRGSGVEGQFLETLTKIVFSAATTKESIELKGLDHQKAFKCVLAKMDTSRSNKEPLYWFLDFLDLSPMSFSAQCR